MFSSSILCVYNDFIIKYAHIIMFFIYFKADVINQGMLHKKMLIHVE